MEERGRTPLISPKPSKSRLQETATVPARAASLAMVGSPKVRGDLVCVEPSNKAVSLLSWNLTKPWASEEEKKKSPSTRNKPAVIWAMEIPDVSRQNTVANGSGPTGKEQRALVCIAEPFSFHLYTQA